MKLDVAIRSVQDAERALAHDLLVVGEQHAAEADVYVTAHTLAQQCAQQLELLAPFGNLHGVPDDGDGVGEPNTLAEWLRRTGSKLTARSSAPGVMFLHDLRGLLLSAYDAELAWVVLGQVGNAIRDRALLDAVCTGHERAEIRCKWLRTRIKEAAPQILVVG